MYKIISLVSFAFLVLIGGFFIYTNQAFAADTINTSTYLDSNANGTVERIRWSMDETVTTCNYEAGDWTVNTSGSISVLITGLSCTGSDGTLDILISADTNETGGAVDPVISYSDLGTAGSVALTSGNMGAHSSVTATDGAKPIVVSKSPAAGAGSVLTNSNISIIFSESMDTASTEAALSLSPSKSFTSSWSAGNTTLIASPVSALLFGTRYTVSLAGTAESSAVGDPDLSATSWQFNTINADGTPTPTNTGNVTDAPIATLTLIAPNGGESLSVGANYTISWSSSGLSTNLIKISLSKDSGSSYPEILATSETNDGSYAWILPSVPSANLRIKIDALDSEGRSVISDISNSNFSIVQPTVPTPVQSVREAPVPTEVTQTVTTPGLSVAGAITLQNGDLIKGSGSAIYLYTADGKRHAFPNEQIYQTWFSGFSNVRLIPDDQLSAISLGQNMRVRAGTKLIKITSDPKVYAVEPGGIIRWLMSEDVANTLYGPGWNQRVIDLDVSLFGNYYQGEAIASNYYPQGSLIKSGSTIYHIENDKRRAFISDAIFSSYYYKNEFVIDLGVTGSGPTTVGNTIISSGPVFGIDGLELLPL